MRREIKEALLAWLSFFGSLSTLLCCTLPILFVVLGFGASLVVFSTHFQWWVKLGEYKFWLFIVSAALLIFSYWIMKMSGQVCPTDPILAKKCEYLRKWNWRIILISFIIWGVGFISAYLLTPIGKWLGFF